jgi:hypothetical protein
MDLLLLIQLFPTRIQGFNLEILHSIRKYFSYLTLNYTIGKRLLWFTEFS